MILLSSIVAGVILFTLTDLDDLLLLVAFFGDPRYRVIDIVAGQFAGMSAILLVSIAASMMSWAIPAAAVGLLGFIPIALGVQGIVQLA